MSLMLTPLQQPIALFDQLVARQTETIVLKEKILSLTGDSFSVTLASGAPVLTVKGRFFTIGGRKSVYDASGVHLFDIKQDFLHLHATYVLEDPKGKKFFEVKNKFKLMGSEAVATFTDRSGRQVSLTMKGNWIDRTAQIVDDSSGVVVAQITRSILSARNVLFDRDSYGAVVAPGMDMSLIAAMCICLDEKNNES